MMRAKDQIERCAATKIVYWAAGVCWSVTLPITKPDPYVVITSTTSANSRISHYFENGNTMTNNRIEDP